MRISTKKIAYLGLITAVAVLLNIFDFSVAGGSFKISLTYLPTFVAGYYFGPWAGLLVGGVGDILGCLIYPRGPWIPLMTVASALMGMIPGFVRIIKANKRLLIVFSYTLTYMICSFFLNSFALWQVYAATKKTLWVYILGRNLTQFPNMILNLVINLAAFPLFERIISPRANGVKTEEKQATS